MLPLSYQINSVKTISSHILITLSTGPKKKIINSLKMYLQQTRAVSFIPTPEDLEILKHFETLLLQVSIREKLNIAKHLLPLIRYFEDNAYKLTNRRLNGDIRNSDHVDINFDILNLTLLLYYPKSKDQLIKYWLSSGPSPNITINLLQQYVSTNICLSDYNDFKHPESLWGVIEEYILISDEHKQQVIYLLPLLGYFKALGSNSRESILDMVTQIKHLQADYPEKSLIEIIQIILHYAVTGESSYLKVRPRDLTDHLWTVEDIQHFCGEAIKEYNAYFAQSQKDNYQALISHLIRLAIFPHQCKTKTIKYRDQLYQAKRTLTKIPSNYLIVTVYLFEAVVYDYTFVDQALRASWQRRGGSSTTPCIRKRKFSTAVSGNFFSTKKPQIEKQAYTNKQKITSTESRMPRNKVLPLPYEQNKLKDLGVVSKKHTVASKRPSPKKKLFKPQPRRSKHVRALQRYQRKKNKAGLQKLLKLFKRRLKKKRVLKKTRVLFFKHLHTLKKTNILTLLWAAKPKLYLIRSRFKLKKRYHLTKYFKLNRRKNKKKRQKRLFSHFFYRKYYFFYIMSRLLIKKQRNVISTRKTYYLQAGNTTYQNLLNKFWNVTTLATHQKQTLQERKTIKRSITALAQNGFLNHITYYLQPRIDNTSPLAKFQFQFFFKVTLKKQIQILLRKKIQRYKRRKKYQKLLTLLSKIKQKNRKKRSRTTTLFKMIYSKKKSKIGVKRDRYTPKRVRKSLSLIITDFRLFCKIKKQRQRSRQRYMLRQIRRQLRRAKRIKKRKRRTTRRKLKIRAKKYKSILLLKKLNNIHLQHLLKKKLATSYYATKLTRSFLKKFSNAFHTYLNASNVQFFFSFRLFQMMNRQFRKNRIFFYKVTNIFSQLKTLTSIKKIVQSNLTKVATLNLKVLAAKRFNRRVFYQSLKQRYYTRRFFSNHELLPIMLNCFFKRTSTYYLLSFIGFLLHKFKKHYGVLTHINRFFIYFFKLTNSHAPIKGLKYIIRGRVNGAPRKKNKIYSFGSIRNNTFKTTLDYTQLSRETRYGTFGLRMWRYF